MESSCAIYFENNRYGMGTAVNRSAAGKDLYERATVFGIEGEKINGMDFFEVSQAAIRARDIFMKIQSLMF